MSDSISFVSTEFTESLAPMYVYSLRGHHTGSIYDNFEKHTHDESNGEIKRERVREKCINHAAPCTLTLLIVNRCLKQICKHF